MAVVNLSELWVNDVANLADYVTTDGFAQEDESVTVAGGVRRYANGRRRLVTTPGVATSLQVAFPVCARPTVAWLRARVGKLVQVRDPSGRIDRGVYLSLDVSEKGSGLAPDVSFTFESTTWSAAV